jgi:PEP-CTERM motif
MITAPRTLAGVAFLIVFSSIASADLITVIGPTSLTNADPTQLGRLARDGVPQDWAGSEPFPGILNTATSYHYETFAVNVGLTPYIQIIIDDVATTEFASAYLGFYNPSNLALNWLGDAGSSGNVNGVAPSFQIFAPVNSTIVIVVNNTTGGTLTDANNGTFKLTIGGYLDPNFTSSAVPEPSSVILMATGLVAMALVAVKRRGRMGSQKN